MALPQSLVLSFHKKAASQLILTVTRADGTTTWSKLYPGMEAHDLAHYVVETELSLADAFYGILARGYDIQDFELPRDQRPAALQPANLSPASLQVEHLVNLLLTELQYGSLLPDFTDQLANILAEAGLPLMAALNQTSLDDIRIKLRELLTEWKRVPVGERLQLSME